VEPNQGPGWSKRPLKKDDPRRGRKTKSARGLKSRSCPVQRGQVLGGKKKGPPGTKVGGNPGPGLRKRDTGQRSLRCGLHQQKEGPTTQQPQRGNREHSKGSTVALPVVPLSSGRGPDPGKKNGAGVILRQEKPCSNGSQKEKKNGLIEVNNRRRGPVEIPRVGEARNAAAGPLPSWGSGWQKPKFREDQRVCCCAQACLPCAGGRANRPANAGLKPWGVGADKAPNKALCSRTGYKKKETTQRRLPQTGSTTILSPTTAMKKVWFVA